jgi:hypothetical protein
MMVKVDRWLGRSGAGPSVVMRIVWSSTTSMPEIALV